MRHSIFKILKKESKTSKEKTVQRLRTKIIELKSKLDKLNQNAVRNRKLDFEILSEEELNQELGSRRPYEKKQLLLTQIGYLRINLFQEYYERINLAQESQDLDGAVQLMGQYIKEVAMPNIQERVHPSILTRISNLFSKSTLPDAAQTLREWQTSYEEWNMHQNANTVDNGDLIKEFDKIKEIFITLYTLSFSPRNFPPVSAEPLD